VRRHASGRIAPRRRAGCIGEAGGGRRVAAVPRCGEERLASQFASGRAAVDIGSSTRRRCRAPWRATQQVGGEDECSRMPPSPPAKPPAKPPSNAAAASAACPGSRPSAPSARSSSGCPACAAQACLDPNSTYIYTPCGNPGERPRCFIIQKVRSFSLLLRLSRLGPRPSI